MVIIMKRVNSLNIKVGQKLKNARLAAGFTQEQVAEKLDCSNRYIGQLETDRTLGSIDFILELCNLYNVTLNDIYSEYLKFDFDELKENFPNIVGYYNLNDEFNSIIDNNIQYLNSLQNRK